MKDSAYFAKVSGKPEAHTVALLKQFADLCVKLDDLNLRGCNEGLTREEESRREALISQAKNVATKSLKCGFYYTDDPRGNAIRLVRPDKKSNSFDGETWFVEE